MIGQSRLVTGGPVTNRLWPVIRVFIRIIGRLEVPITWYQVVVRSSTVAGWLQMAAESNDLELSEWAFVGW